MTRVKAEEHDQLHAIFACRHEAGLQAMRAWLFANLAKINSQWIGLEGDELIRLQGEAKKVAKLIDMIDAAPAVPKSTEGVNHG